MDLLPLHTAFDTQQQLANFIKEKRRKKKWSRQALAERSTVPASTIKKFETTGQISLRQFVLLWQSVDRLDALVALTHESEPEPGTIDEVLKR